MHRRDAVSIAIPFVRQPQHRQQRMCGAAALAMIYRYWAGESAHGVPPQHRTPAAKWPTVAGDSPASAPQRTASPPIDRDTLTCQMIWGRIATNDGRGGRYARCYRLAADLCHAGIAATVLQAAAPWTALQAAAQAGLPTIVNLRLAADSALGHFAVVTAIGSEHIGLHDPQFGPNRLLQREPFLQLWTTAVAGGETVGSTMIVAAGPQPVLGALRPWPEQTCGRCQRPFPIPPIQSLLAAASGVFCPWCDQGWQLRVAGV